MTFERTQNSGLVRYLLTLPEIWPYVGDDFAPAREAWQPNMNPGIWYVVAREGDDLIGLFTFLPRSTVLWEAHIALVRERRARGAEIASAALAWLFEHSAAERIVAEIPACNRLAVRLASHVMTQIGVNERAFMKGGTLQDLVLFGLSKGENNCRVS